MGPNCPPLPPQDCPPEAGDFRAQQCSAHADVRFQGRFHEWLPVYNDPENPCALRCRAKASGLVLELAPKVLDGTRCYTESLDMCISGVCQVGLGGPGALGPGPGLTASPPGSRSWAVIMSWAPAPRRTTVGCVGATAPPAGWCEEPTARSRAPVRTTQAGQNQARLAQRAHPGLFAPARPGHGGGDPLPEPPRPPGSEGSGSLV